MSAAISHKRKLDEMYRPGSPLRDGFGQKCKGVSGRILNTAFDDLVVKSQAPCQRARREARIHCFLSRSGCPHIPYVADYDDEQGEFIVMEKSGYDLFSTYFCSSNPLRKEIDSLDSLEPLAKKYLEALCFTHQRGIAHLDIKLNNCTDEHVLDFGFAEYVFESGLTLARVKKQKFTPLYRPPEVVLQFPFDGKGDIWSLGCLLFSLYTKEWLIPLDPNRELSMDSQTIQLLIKRFGPTSISSWMIYKCKIRDTFFTGFDSDQLSIKAPDIFAPIPTFHSAIQTAKRDKDSQERVSQFIDLLSGMLKIDPYERFSAEQALNHPFFNSKISADLSFKLEVRGQERPRMLIKGQNQFAKIVDLAKVHFGSCFHIPKSANPCTFEFFQNQSLRTIAMDIKEGEIIPINTDLSPEWGLRRR